MAQSSAANQPALLRLRSGSAGLRRCCGRFRRRRRYQRQLFHNVETRAPHQSRHSRPRQPCRVVLHEQRLRLTIELQLADPVDFARARQGDQNIFTWLRGIAKQNIHVRHRGRISAGIPGSLTLLSIIASDHHHSRSRISRGRLAFVHESCLVRPDQREMEMHRRVIERTRRMRAFVAHQEGYLGRACQGESFAVNADPAATWRSICYRSLQTFSCEL